MAVDVATTDAGAHLVAAATPRAVYVYLVAGDEAEPAGGYDLLRGEGGVLDLAFVDGDPTRLAVLHSDLFVDELDPQAPPERVAADAPPAGRGARCGPHRTTLPGAGASRLPNR